MRRLAHIDCRALEHRPMRAVSAFLPSRQQNARRPADRRAGFCHRLARTATRPKVGSVRVWQGFQSFPAFHRYPFTQGRLCVSPSHPPSRFRCVDPSHSTRNRCISTETLTMCRYLASGGAPSVSAGVPQGQLPAKINRTTLLPKGAYNASRKTNSFDHGLGQHGSSVCMRPVGHHVPIGFLNVGHADALIPLLLTNSQWLPGQFASRGRFAMSSQNTKDSLCSKRS